VPEYPTGAVPVYNSSKKDSLNKLFQTVSPYFERQPGRVILPVPDNGALQQARARFEKQLLADRLKQQEIDSDM
jgi:hypothetical protein